MQGKTDHECPCIVTLTQSQQGHHTHSQDHIIVRNHYLNVEYTLRITSAFVEVSKWLGVLSPGQLLSFLRTVFIMFNPDFVAAVELNFRNSATPLPWYLIMQFLPEEGEVR